MTERRTPLDLRTPARGTTPREAHAREPGPRRRARAASRTRWVEKACRAASCAAIAGLTAFAVAQGAQWLRHGDLLPVRTIAVRGVDDARAEEVRAYAGIALGDPLLGVDLGAVVARVQEHPFVRSVSVRRVPPERLELTVDERRPVALLALPALYLVDDEGVVLKRAVAGDGLDLPLITGLDAAAVDAARGAPLEEVRRALSILDEHQRSGGPGGAISELAVRPRVGLDVVFTDGMRVRMGNDGLRAKVALLATVVARLQAQQAAASFIYLDDARRPERVTVRLRTPPEPGRVSGT